MYLSYFGFDSTPFSIVPDHRALYMSESHRDAVAHLLYALRQSGGFVQLTGEVGTGKTTVCRYLLYHLPQDVDVALLLNPRINELEMLQAICDELKIDYHEPSSIKGLLAEFNIYLLRSHARGRHTVLIIDEAQNLSREVLEQVRLLTNLETSTHKLLQIILIGQPELEQTLARHDLRQLSQRIIGRFKLESLNSRETREYIEHRLRIYGAQKPLFTRGAISRIHTLSGGIPRLINILCDRALLGAYSEEKQMVSQRIVIEAGREVLVRQPTPSIWRTILKYSTIALLPLLAYLAYSAVQNGSIAIPGLSQPTPVSTTVPAGQPTRPDASASANDSAQSGKSESDKAGFDLGYRLGVPLKQD